MSNGRVPPETVVGALRRLLSSWTHRTAARTRSEVTSLGNTNHVGAERGMTSLAAILTVLRSQFVVSATENARIGWTMWMRYA